eukprot:jgi/Galph1/466/GphlegSOOS_G5191.1
MFISESFVWPKTLTKCRNSKLCKTCFWRSRRDSVKRARHLNSTCVASLVEDFRRKLNKGDVQDAFVLFKQLPASSLLDTQSAYQLLNLATSHLLHKKYAGQVQVAEIYEELKRKNILRAFRTVDSAEKLPVAGKLVSIDLLVREANVTPESLRPQTRSILSYQVAGISLSLALIFIGKYFHMETFIRPLGIGLLFSFLSDQLVLQGAVSEELYKTIFPIYKQKVLKHEAGHFLISYLLGCPLRGVVLTAWEALRLGIPGQAGTLFFDQKLESELSTGFITDATIDRYSIVLMAGIAAEALEYGQAEGGQSDEAALLRLLTSLNPPWLKERIFNQARWAVLQAILLIKQQRKAYYALVKCLEERKPLGDCIATIETFYQPFPVS